MHYFQDGVAHSLERLYAGGEGQQEDVEPGDEEGDGPAQEPEDDEPEDAPQDAGAQAALAFALTRALPLSFAQSHGRSDPVRRSLAFGGVWRSVNRQRERQREINILDCTTVRSGCIVPQTRWMSLL